MIRSMPAPAPIRISKSKFVAGMQCLKRLYLQVHQPELEEEADEGRDARLEQGQEVGLLAQKRFPGGAPVGFENGIEDALAQTAALMEDASVPAIFEATFQHANVLVRVDVLQRRPNGRWRLIEVKSSVEVKPHYLYDAAIQYHVLSACGLDISTVCLMHLNRDYRYDGMRHDLGRLFTIRDQTTQIRKLDAEIPGLLRAQWKCLAQPEAPGVLPDAQCGNPYRCEFYSHCNAELPEHHISFLPRLSGQKLEALKALGVSRIPEIPEDFPLTGLQARIRAAVTSGHMWVSETARRELSGFRYPLCFMDFETVNPAIPRFAGMWPYAQLPFQWSVHRQVAPGARLEHFEFLAGDEGDPRPGFMESLCAAVGRRGQIVVYGAGFESRRLAELAEALPEYQERVRGIRGRMLDLLPFVRRHVYHPGFGGSFSLKQVLPALAPGMSYEGMRIGNGSEAGLAWEQMIRGGLDAGERRRLKAALLDYCAQDTLGMVRILGRLSGGRAR